MSVQYLVDYENVHEAGVYGMRFTISVGMTFEF